MPGWLKYNRQQPKPRPSLDVPQRYTAGQATSFPARPRRAQAAATHITVPVDPVIYCSQVREPVRRQASPTPGDADVFKADGLNGLFYLNDFTRIQRPKQKLLRRLDLTPLYTPTANYGRPWNGCHRRQWMPKYT